MKIPHNAINRVVEACFLPGVRSSVLYLTETFIIKATRRHKPDGRSKTTEIVLTCGSPNYEGRKFAKACVQSGESFPVKKLQLKWYKKWNIKQYPGWRKG